MEIRKLVWTGGNKSFPNDIFSEPVFYSRYQIGPRQLSSGNNVLYLFGPGGHTKIMSIIEGKELAQREFESRVMKEYFE